MEPRDAAHVLDGLYITGDSAGAETAAAKNEAIRMGADAMRLGQAVSLNELMAMQRELMNLLGIPSRLTGNPIQSTLYKDTLIMMAGEVAEALEPCTLASKPWKQRAPAELLAESTDEVIDVFFFLMEALLMLGLTPEQVRERYVVKREEIITKRLGASNG